jgi:hypothetical protein
MDRQAIDEGGQMDEAVHSKRLQSVSSDGQRTVEKNGLLPQTT